MRDEIVHGSCVALDGKGVLILGASGSGKSGFALELMALGAMLVADDRVVLRREDHVIRASAPGAIKGRIEARFVGILKAETLDEAPLALVIDLDRQEGDRLPPQRSRKTLGISLPLLHNADTRYFPAAILQYLRAGRSE